jgi:hypothetical protein
MRRSGVTLCLTGGRVTTTKVAPAAEHGPDDLARLVCDQGCRVNATSGRSGIVR